LPYSALLTTTLILLVVIGAKVSFRSTLLFPVTLPFGIVTQVDPSQYCTSKAVIPYREKAMFSSGGVVLSGLSCTVTTSISLTVLVPEKSTCNQSGHALSV